MIEDNYERTINGYIFRLTEDDMIEVYNGETLVSSFLATGVKDQKSFDKEISYWYMDNAGNI